VPSRRSSGRRSRARREPASERPEGVRPQWSGTLSFGLVSIPVDLYGATRGGGVALRMLAPDGTPLARRFYCPDDGEPVPYEHLVRGFEHAKGQHVVVTDEELEALAPEKSRDIDLRSFVERSALDPVYFERSFFLFPGGTSSKAYHLLAQVMESKGRAGIGSFVMRDREYVVAILADGGLLRAQTLRFSDQIRSIEGLKLPRARVKSADVERFAKAIRKHARDALDLEQLHDESADALRKLAQTKARSERNVVHADVGEDAQSQAEIVDLMAVLQRSLGERGGRAKRKRAATPRRKSR
jgi:DNA end-binding protein Ku